MQKMTYHVWKESSHHRSLHRWTPIWEWSHRFLVFPWNEFDTSLTYSSNLRYGDENGLIVDMINYGSMRSRNHILMKFNNICRAVEIHEDWCHIIFKMPQIDGNLSLISNWRPIVIFPIRYKLFVWMIHNRFSPSLFRPQSVDQHIFTFHIRLEDALVIVENDVEYVLEFDTPIWMMSTDIWKTFDIIDHKVLLNGLRTYGVVESYINLLGKLYICQMGTVNDSSSFPIIHGVTQGDILSVILSDCVLDIVFETWKEWVLHDGLYIKDMEWFINIRYPDDILLYDKSISESLYMSELLISELMIVGPILNVVKTKISHTTYQDDMISINFVDITSEMIEILHPGLAHRYLVWKFSLCQTTRTDIELKFGKQHTWNVFHKHTQVILNT